jgi:hypothetical protein
MTPRFSLTAEGAINLLNGAVAQAKDNGLPWPEEPLILRPSRNLVELVRLSQLEATKETAEVSVPPGQVFPRLARKDGSERRHAHAILVFDTPVRGPVLIGAGRYRGYGVGRPIGEV